MKKLIALALAGTIALGACGQENTGGVAIGLLLLIGVAGGVAVGIKMWRDLR